MVDNTHIDQTRIERIVAAAERPAHARKRVLFSFISEPYIRYYNFNSPELY